MQVQGRGRLKMIYITGDCHSNFERFNTRNFPEQKEMTKDDYVIICGDFGGVWNKDGESKMETGALDWLDGKAFTTLFVDVNHENFDRLYAYPVEMWHGGKAHKIRPSVIDRISWPGKKEKPFVFESWENQDHSKVVHAIKNILKIVKKEIL